MAEQASHQTIDIQSSHYVLMTKESYLIVALPPGASKYRSELEHGRNRFRWVEYSMSATLMIEVRVRSARQPSGVSTSSGLSGLSRSMKTSWSSR